MIKLNRIIKILNILKTILASTISVIKKCAKEYAERKGDKW